MRCTVVHGSVVSFHLGEYIFTYPVCFPKAQLFCGPRQKPYYMYMRLVCKQCINEAPVLRTCMDHPSIQANICSASPCAQWVKTQYTCVCPYLSVCLRLKCMNVCVCVCVARRWKAAYSSSVYFVGVLSLPATTSGWGEMRKGEVEASTGGHPTWS